MLRELILRFDERHPALGDWLGGRLDLQVPAIGASILTHLVLLLTLGMIGYASTHAKPPEFRTELVTASLSDFAKMDTTELAEVDKPTVMTPVAGSFSPTPRALMVEAPIRPPEPVKSLPELSGQAVSRVASVVLPTASHLDRMVSIQGSGAEHVGGVEGAVDRIAVEILRRMEQGRTLVVWAFDASGSLAAERERLAKYIDAVYGHIAELDKEQLAQSGGLLTAVVSFGHDRKVLTAEPTGDRQSVASAIAAVGLDTTGIETTFQTVVDIVRKWGHYKKDGEAYHTMIVVVTDEVGDDEDHLEDAIGLAQTAKVPVYVLGSPALFGRVEGYMNYTDPKTKQTYYNLPVRQGPESAALEGIRLPFWYDGPQFEFMDAGFGPYALSRLSGATGGIYFITRMGGPRLAFDPAGMREYKPDWVSKEQYMLAVNRHPVRQAVMRSSLITQQALPGQPGLNFPAADGPEFKEALTRSQEVVARVEYTVNEAWGPIALAAKAREHETSRRWQAHYDLIRGRLMAMKIRCLEYNMACARMKKDAPKFTKPTSNSWRLVPDTEIHITDRAAKDSRLGATAQGAFDEARALLQKVVKEHVGTPWARLAERELKDPFGFKWEEATVQPRPRQMSNAEVAAAKKKAQPKPPPAAPVVVPKL